MGPMTAPVVPVKVRLPCNLLHFGRLRLGGCLVSRMRNEPSDPIFISQRSSEQTLQFWFLTISSTRNFISFPLNLSNFRRAQDHGQSLFWPPKPVSWLSIQESYREPRVLLLLEVHQDKHRLNKGALPGQWL